MAVTIREGHTPELLAQEMLGDSRLIHELVIPGWRAGQALPIGQKAYLRGEPVGPPSRNWTRPQR